MGEKVAGFFAILFASAVIFGAGLMFGYMLTYGALVFLSIIGLLVIFWGWWKVMDTTFLESSSGSIITIFVIAFLFASWLMAIEVSGHSHFLADSASVISHFLCNNVFRKF